MIPPRTLLLLPLLGPSLARSPGSPSSPLAGDTSPYSSYQSDPKAGLLQDQGSPSVYPGGEGSPRQEGATRPNFSLDDLEEETIEEMPYTVIQDYGNYELRKYPSVSLVCTTHQENPADDPFADMENINPWRIMQSRQWKKRASSIMFMRLFKYISGVNQEGEEVEMTIPVTTLNKMAKDDSPGNLVNKKMCFYLPSKYQTGQATPPQPMEGKKVFLYTRPEMEMYVHRFGGFAMTTKTWVKHYQKLMRDLNGKQVKDDEYITTSYDSPWKMENRRNEVWVQSVKGEAADNVIIREQ